MAKIFYSFLIILISSSFGIPQEEPAISEYTPVLMTREQLENSVQIFSPKPLSQPGKIYRYGDFLFISEVRKGVHIIDNTNPATPINKGFISIPGNFDMGIKDGYLQADNAVDLITIDLRNPSSIKVTNRIRNTFPEMSPPDKQPVPSVYSKEKRPENTVIVDWTKNK